MKKYQLLSILFLLIFYNGAVFAQGNRGMIDRLDSNSDGRISREEFLSTSHRRGDSEKKFNRLDIDGDGYITREEMKDRWKRRQESGRKRGMTFIDQFDSNSDGRVSREEFLSTSHRRGDPEKKFNRLDTDGNGYITREEMKDRWKKRQESGRKRGMTFIDQFDSNSDGRISREEFLSTSHRRGDPEKKFNRLDTDKDGYITREEMENRWKDRERSSRKQGMDGGW